MQNRLLNDCISIVRKTKRFTRIYVVKMGAEIHLVRASKRLYKL